MRTCRKRLGQESVETESLAIYWLRNSSNRFSTPPIVGRRAQAYWISTSATRFSALSAITRLLPLTVFIMFRTTPPPAGMI
jgi:hypothetical protein